MILTIKKGGKLTKTEWVFDEAKDEGSYVTTDVTDPSYCYLHRICELEEGITLRDIFLLINKELTFYSILLQNNTKELIDEGLNKPPKSTKEVDYLELYWLLEKTTYEGEVELTGHHFPDFHGWGNWDVDKKGAISLSFIPVNEIIDIPLKLTTKTSLFHSNIDAKWDTLEELNKQTDPVIEFDKCSFTLYHILYGIMWELSFLGTPEERDKEFEYIKDLSNKALKSLKNDKD